MAGSAREELILSLFEAGCIQFGSFKLKTGMMSPVYFDLRVIVSYPKLMVNCCAESLKAHVVHGGTLEYRRPVHMFISMCTAVLYATGHHHVHANTTKPFSIFHVLDPFLPGVPLPLPSPPLPLPLQSTVSDCLWNQVQGIHDTIQSVCGVPYTALPLATVSLQPVSTQHCSYHSKWERVTTGNEE